MALTILTTDYGIADTPRLIAGRVTALNGQNQFQNYYADGETNFLSLSFFALEQNNFTCQMH